MRIEPGHHRHTSNSGQELHLDQPCPASLVEHLAAAIEASGKTPSDVTAAEVEGDTVTSLHCLARDSAGEIVLPPDVRVIRL